MPPRKRKSGLAAKTTIEQGKTRQPKGGKVYEDGSYSTSFGKVYDPDTKRLRPKIKTGP